MKNLKIKNIAWGLFFIISGALIIINQTGSLMDFNLWTLILGLLLVPVFITSIAHINFGGILFPAALWAILFSEPLGLEKFTPWPVLGAALFLTIGLSIIFPKKHHFKHDNSEDWDNESFDGECLKINSKFSGSSKYINSEYLKNCEINCSFGGMKIYFDNAQIDGDTAVAKLGVEFSGVELFVPKEWIVECDNLERKASGVNEEGGNRCTKSGKKLVLQGHLFCSGLTIKYI